MKPKFIHLRYSSIMDDSVSAKGGATLAFHVIAGNVAIYAMSECNPCDNFDRSKGRIQAEGRLKSPGWQRSVTVPDVKDIKEVISLIKEDYLTYKAQFMPNVRDFLGWYGKSWA